MSLLNSESAQPPTTSPMASFANLAKRIVLLNRTRKQFEAQKQPSSPQRPLAPLPTSLSGRIPQELFERCRLQGLGTGEQISSLRTACCTFSKPDVDEASRQLRDPNPYNTGGKQCILFGTDNGVLLCSLASGAPPSRVLSMPDPVTQIDVLEKHNLVVLLSGHRIMTIPLNILQPAMPRDSSSCTRVSSHATFFKVGVISGRHLVCVVKAGLSTTCKLMEPVRTPSQGYSLQLYKEFYISERVTSIHFLRTKLVAGTSRHDFEVVDVETLITQPLLDPSATHHDSKSMKCRAVFRTGHDLLLCYHSFALHVNNQGHPITKPPVRWRSDSVHTVVLRKPYLLAFGAGNIEVRHANNGSLVQTIWIGHSVLCVSPELLMIQADDGRLLGLQFID
ncbi:hypothetical protein D9615_001539 [Tricholomella constricta]|uniref:CNH domain-containing protein n=1 Tax=Tricholomella constricta TaxID=117010 RepID=A0A8H5MAP0_9AGAR|nr:hypothetical protein D9615_001539 [Tricholomella constricta]